MSRISRAFENKKAFITFITGGDPDINTTKELIFAMEEAGADLIEIGIPFSDPVAEGPIIQAADERALSNGCTTDDLFLMVSQIREKSEIPLVFMTYINPIYTYGKERFFKKCNEVGIDGVIVPDMPFEEKHELLIDAKNHGVTLISMIAPTSNDRIAMIAKESEGFLYCVSSLGVTGVRNEISTDINAMISEVKKVTNTPAAIGFGISNAIQAKEMSKIADGVIVGSAIVKIIAEYGQNSVGPVKKFVSTIKNAMN